MQSTIVHLYVRIFPIIHFDLKKKEIEKKLYIHTPVTICHEPEDHTLTLVHSHGYMLHKSPKNTLNLI